MYKNFAEFYPFLKKNGRVVKGLLLFRYEGLDGLEGTNKYLIVIPSPRERVAAAGRRVRELEKGKNREICTLFEIPHP
jgi:hypothetical protein